MSLQSLLESEVISDDLKIEMLTRVAENLEIPITEELIDEWELNLPGGRKLSYTKEPEKDAFDIAREVMRDISKEKAQAKTAAQAPAQPEQKAPAQPEQKAAETPQTSGTTDIGQTMIQNAQGSTNKSSNKKTYKVNTQNDNKSTKALKRLGEIRAKLKNTTTRGEEGRLKGNRTQIRKGIRNVGKLRNFVDKLRNKTITKVNPVR